MVIASDELTKIIEDEYSNTAALVVVKDNEIAFEYYASGFSGDSALHVSSVTKSIMSMLFGIAVNKGYLTGVDQKVLAFFPEYQLKRGEKTLKEITVEDLLTMRAPYKFKSEPYTKVYASEDWTKTSLDLLGGKGNIGEFKYTTPALHVLSGILTRATGQSVVSFANEHLFGPLGIRETSSISINSRHDYLTFIKSKDVIGWAADPQGVNSAGWGLTLTSRDLVKLGQLYLNKGRWVNEQIVSPKWMRQSTTEQSRWGERAYGYLWWVMADFDKPAFAAIGDGGNVMFVCPDERVVIGMTSRFMPRAKDRIGLIREYILPELR